MRRVAADGFHGVDLKVFVLRLRQKLSPQEDYVEPMSPAIGHCGQATEE
jgi:hypothetical protein